MDGMSAVADEREYWILCYNDGNYIVAFNRAFCGRIKAWTQYCGCCDRSNILRFYVTLKWSKGFPIRSQQCLLDDESIYDILTKSIDSTITSFQFHHSTQSDSYFLSNKAIVCIALKWPARGERARRLIITIIYWNRRVSICASNWIIIMCER